MRVHIHLSEKICDLCRSQYLMELQGELGNKDNTPIKDYPDDNGGNCVICGNYTDTWSGSIWETSEPIEDLKKYEEIIERVRKKHSEYISLLIKIIREARIKGESHIKIP